MIDKSSKLKELQEKEKKYKEKLVAMRLKIGEADCAMESQFPSGRFELEQDIAGIELVLNGIHEEIQKLKTRVKIIHQ
jgi:hypothetical protein